MVMEEPPQSMHVDLIPLKGDGPPRSPNLRAAATETTSVGQPSFLLNGGGSASLEHRATLSGPPRNSVSPSGRAHTHSPRSWLSKELPSNSSASRMTSAREARRTSTTIVTTGVRRRDSLRHPYTLPSSDLNDTQADGTSAAVDGDVRPPPDTADDAHLPFDGAKEGESHRSLSRHRRRMVSPSTRRHLIAASPAPEDQGTCSASPQNLSGSTAASTTDAMANTVAFTPEQVQDAVGEVMRQHDSKLASWETRLSVAEVYRDKPLRTGGRPAPVRSQDRGFLETVEEGLSTHIERLVYVKSMLEQTCAMEPSSAVEVPIDADAWRRYCSHFFQALTDFAAEARLMRTRVRTVLRAGEEDLWWLARHRKTSSRSSSALRASARSGDRPSGGESSRPTSRTASQPTTPRLRRAMREEGSHDGARYAGRLSISPSPYVHTSMARSVQRGGDVIRPGTVDATAHIALRNGMGVSVHQVRRPRPSGGNTGALHSFGGSASPSSSAAFSSVSPGQGRELVPHPDTIIAQPHQTGSTYDARTPYGNLSPRRCASSPSAARSPSRSTFLLLATHGEGKEPRASTPTRASLSVSSCHLPRGATPPRLRTYSSPRGLSSSARAVASAAPVVHPLRHRQIFEIIETFEKNADSLQRGDLQLARTCFSELYGEPIGLHQYCLWIDNIAMKALHRP